jgi:hypothetical protein
MRNLGLLTATVCLSLGPSIVRAQPAEPPITEPMSMVDSVTIDGLTGLLKELGAQNIETRDGGKLLTFQDGPVPYNMNIALCDIRPNKCLALAMGVIMDPGSTSYSHEAINTYNKDNLFVTAIKLDGNKVAFGRIWLVDGGVTKKNLAINISSFVVTFNQALKSLQSQVVAGVQTDPTFKQTSQSAGPKFMVAGPNELEQLTKALVHKTTLGDKR